MEMSEKQQNTTREDVARRLREWISEGKWHPGDRLPSERELAKALQAARRTVRAALEDLAKQGLVDDAGARMRRRVKSSAVGSDGRLLSHTVAMIGNVRDEALPAFRVLRGWDAFIAMEASRILQHNGLHVLQLCVERLVNERNFDFLRQRPHGIIIHGFVPDMPDGQSIAAQAKERSIPTICYGDGPEWSAYDRVAGDHEQGAYDLTQWLISRGRKRILRFWRATADKHLGWLDKRDLGYTRAMRDAGLEPLDAIRTPLLPEVKAFEGRTQQDYLNACRSVLGFLLEPINAGIDAVMTLSDPGAYEIATVLKMLGKKPNVEIDVVGYDNTYLEDIQRPWEPVGPAATMDKNNGEIGQALARLLIDRASGALPDTPVRRLVKPTLVVTP